MRIVSGQLRGRRFSPPDSFSARPTTDFAKENLFNVLNNMIDFEEVKVLDLFSGTGSISYEFASRGSRDITSIELNYKHQQFIAKTVCELNIEKAVRSLKGDSFKYVSATKEKFDIIFADPPFDLTEAEKLPDMIMKRGLLKEGGIFILEHSGKGKYNAHPYFLQTRNYGKVNFTFFGIETDEE
jgi:16S rRNA (guanine(966)-N(2))-methyltransferase RsmD